MPFTAVCSHCRGSKFRVPFKKRGTFATCPKCDHEFLLVPESSVGVPLMEYKALPFDDADDEPARPAAAETVATTPQTLDTAEMPAVAPPVVVVTTEPSERRSNAAYPMALLALGCFGVAMVASQFSYGRFVAVPLAGVGLLLGGLSLLGLEVYRWLGVAAAGLNALGLLFVLLLPSWLGVSGWTPVGDPEAAPKPVTAVGRDGSLPKTADWVDAGKAVWEQGDVRLTVVAVAVGPPDPAVKKSKERALRVTVKLTNVGVARAIEFAGWTPGPPAEAKLTTAAGPLPQRASTTEPATVFPGKSAECVLLFAAPEKPDDFRLELPPQPFGGTDPARFLIPKAFLGRTPTGP